MNVHADAPPRELTVVPRCALHAVPSTLLIPLAARAWGDERYPWLACGDQDARRLLACLEPGARAWLDDAWVVLNVLWRTRVLKEVAGRFFAAHPHAAGVNLGCGLSNPFQWLDTGRNTWVDADLPEVMSLRHTLLPARPPRWRGVAVDLRTPGWWRRLGLPAGRAARRPGKRPAEPVFLLCEGVLMYLRPPQVRAVLQEFAAQAPPGSQFLADFISCLGVGHARWVPSLAHSRAQFHWGAGGWSDFTDAHPRLRLLERHSAAEIRGLWLRLMEAGCEPLLGPALYGMALLGVADALLTGDAT
jgi:O-methyltransferase involved in polyketide biosynthesis